MEKLNLLAVMSRQFLEKHNVYRFRMKSVAEMSDSEVIQACHSYYEENALHDEWCDFSEKIEAEYRYCPYYKEYLDAEYCCNLQMIAAGFEKDGFFIDKASRANLIENCNECKYKL